MNPHLAVWRVSAEEFPAGGYAADVLEFLLSYAILAPSPLNTQPWLFRLDAMAIDLIADRRRARRVADPMDRELTMSCGAALLNLRVAADYFGNQHRVEPLPSLLEPNVLARFHLGLSGETTSEDVLLFPAILQRRSNRRPFTAEPIPAELVDELIAAAEQEGAWLDAITGEERHQWIAELVMAAEHQQWADRRFREEEAQWVRVKPEASSDGLAPQEFGVRGWLGSAAPTLVRRLNRGQVLAAADSEAALHAPLLVVLGTASDEPLAWLAAGQAFQRVLLHAYAGGYSASFLNAPIQIPELREQLAAWLGRDSFPQVLLRLGQGPEVAPTPRRFVRQVLLPRAGRHG